MNDMSSIEPRGHLWPLVTF